MNSTSSLLADFYRAVPAPDPTVVDLLKDTLQQLLHQEGGIEDTEKLAQLITTYEDALAGASTRIGEKAEEYAKWFEPRLHRYKEVMRLAQLIKELEQPQPEPFVPLAKSTLMKRATDTIATAQFVEQNFNFA
jgi:hypothetical protein